MKTGANVLDANLIRVAPMCQDAGGLGYLYCGAFGRKWILLEALKECVKKEMLGMRVPYLFYVPRVVMHHAVGLLGLLHQQTKSTHSFQSCEHHGSPCLLPHHAGQVHVVDVWAWMSGVLCGIDDEKTEAPCTLCIIPGMGSL
jgi:hypothetical protein